MLIFLFSKTTLFAFLVLCNVLGHSLLLKRFIKIEEDNYFFNFISGTISLIFFSYLINFFYPLNQYITNTFFFVFTLIGIYYVGKRKKNLYSILIIIFIVSFMTFLSKSYNDYELYHLPYMEIIRKFKIIFGLSNLDFRYAHSSVFQNISAFQYNSLMVKDSYIFYIPLLTVVSLKYILEKLANTNLNSIKIIGATTIIFFLIHGNRYGALGNDLPTHLIAIISLILYLDLSQKTNARNNESFTFLSIILIVILSKFSMILFCFLPLYLIIKNKIILNYKIIILLLISIFFISKNYINSSCLIYPVPKLCLNTYWSVDKYSYGSPETISLESSVMVKAYMESKFLSNPEIRKNFLGELLKSNKTYSEYNNLKENEKEEYLKYNYYRYYSKFYNWFPEYIKGNDFFKLLKNIILLNLLLYLITFIFIKFYPEKIKKKKMISSFIKNNAFFIFFITLNFILWLFIFPQLRYGLSYVLIFFSLPLLIKIETYEIAIFQKKVINLLIFIAFIYAVYSNSNRIHKTLTYNLDTEISNIVPLSSPKFQEIYIDNSIVLRQPINGTCSDIEQLCTVFTERFLKSNRNISKLAFDYLLIK
tara:strand:+ start:827 stop:2602 length:1776 start_codon:yes stop_codon:yes gene_type:complete